MCHNSKSWIFLIGNFSLPGSTESYYKHVCIMTKASMFDIMLAYDLIQMTDEAAHIHGSSSSVSDLGLVKCDIKEYSLRIEQISDHYIVDVSFPVLSLKKCHSSLAKYFKDYSRGNDACIVECIKNCLSDFGNTDACILRDCFQYMCHYCIDNILPNKWMYVNKQTTWMTRDIIHQKCK